MELLLVGAPIASSGKLEPLDLRQLVHPSEVLDDETVTSGPSNMELTSEKPKASASPSSSSR